MRILHLSDLHASPDAAFRVKWACLMDALDQLPGCWKPDALALTGDYCFDARAQEFQLAGSCLRELLHCTGIRPDHVAICPGNHDGEYRNGKMDFTVYSQFCRSENFLRVNDSDDGLLVKEIDRINFTLMNSCFEASPENYDNATIPPKAALQIQKSYMKKSPGVLLMHHQSQAFSNSALFLQLASCHTLILSGHVHANRPVVRRLGSAVEVNGMAITPHDPEISTGCQIIRMEQELPVDLAVLYADSSRQPNFIFEQFEEQFL